MKNKHSDVDRFATYAKFYNQYKKNTTSYQQKVEYIKSLYEVSNLSCLVVYSKTPLWDNPALRPLHYSLISSLSKLNSKTTPL